MLPTHSPSPELCLLSAVSTLEGLGASIHSLTSSLHPCAAQLKDFSILLVGTHKKLEPPSWLREMHHWSVIRYGISPSPGQVWVPRLGPTRQMIALTGHLFCPPFGVSLYKVRIRTGHINVRLFVVNQGFDYI